MAITSGRALLTRQKWNFMDKSRDLAKCSYANAMELGNDDGISCVPAELVMIILSSLPLKEMVKTSILSRQWLNLWVNTPVLDFYLGLHASDYMTRNYLVKWINHVLKQHKGLYLKKFRICCFLMNDYQEDIDRWLEFALSRKVEVLELNFLYVVDFCFVQEHNYVFPDCDCWFSSSGKANNVNGGGSCKSRVLLQYNLKFLKSLSLKGVNVTGEAVNFLLRNCPFLERLELVGSNRLVNLVISDPTLVLKYLQITQCRGLQVVSISNFNLVSLDTSVGDLFLKDLPMLVDLSLFGYSNSLRGILSQSATCLRQLKSLELNASNLEEVTELPSNLAQMTKLKRLVIKYSAIVEESLTVLLYLIKSCNRLEEFVLELDWGFPKRFDRTMRKVERLRCESLRLFEFKGYNGRTSDVELVMNVVQNAPGLEKIIIDTFDLRLRKMNYPEDMNELEARRLALKQIEHLRESNYIPPHVAVFIGRNPV